MITTLIFDWGGVLTVGKYTQSILEVLSKERPVSTKEIYPDFDSLIVQMNEGALSFRAFVATVNLRFNLKISEAEMGAIFRQAIVPNYELIWLVGRLHSNYTLVLLSDTDEMTVKNLKKYHQKMLGFFSKKYFSHELKMRKPNTAFFKHVLSDLKVPADECLFIDDKQKNVAAAEECGMKGILFCSVGQLKKELLSNGLKFD
jgi:putative hydrolase of the HAD superfamily